MSNPIIVLGHVQEITRPTWRVGEETFEAEHLAHKHVAETYIAALLEQHAEMGQINVEHAAAILLEHSAQVNAAVERYERARRDAGKGL